MRAEGSAEQLVGIVKQKTGATRREIEHFLTSVLGPEHPWTSQIAEAAQHSEEARVYLQQNARKVVGQTSDYSAKVAETVRAKPTEDAG